MTTQQKDSGICQIHRKHLALENFWWEKYVDLVKVVGGNTVYACAVPVLLITTYDSFGE